MEDTVIGSITFNSQERSFKPFRSPDYRELLEKMIDQAKKEKHKMDDVLEDVIKKWKGWDN